MIYKLDKTYVDEATRNYEANQFLQ
ncbi:uncharacterized protein METZ01_LOCUS412708 [marine metagenome]|uniref:Uncharacterized protein n=1 Tax=marine metagenome TaxID=408172 RepID=A0A382WMN9_9ZZZZ